MDVNAFVEILRTTLTLEWASWVVPLSLLLSLVVSRVSFAPLFGFIVLVLHHAGQVALPMLTAGEKTDAITAAIMASFGKLDPLVLAIELVGCIFFVAVFSLAWRDMFRARVGNTEDAH